MYICLYDGPCIFVYMMDQHVYLFLFFSDESTPGASYVACPTNKCLNAGLCWLNSDGSTRCSCPKGKLKSEWSLTMNKMC